MDEWLAALRIGNAEAAWDVFIARYRRLVFAAIRHYARDHDDVMDVFAHVCEALRADGMRRIRRYVDARQHRARFTTWLVTVVRHLTVDWFRLRDGRRRGTLSAGLELSPLGRQIFEHVYVQGCGHSEAYELICSRDPPGPSFREYLAELRSSHLALQAGRLGQMLRDLAPPPIPRTELDPAELADQRERLDHVLRALEPDQRVMLELYVVDELPAAEVARIVGLPNAKAVYNGVYRLLEALRSRFDSAGILRGDL